MQPLEMSGHSDYKQICQMLTKGCDQKKLKSIILIHGDEDSKANLKNEIAKSNREVDIKIAQAKETIKC